MIYTTHRVSLDIHDTSSQVFITVKRGVTNRQIFAYLTEDGKPYTLTEDCYAVFDGKKDDGGILHNSCEINGNCIKYNFTEATVSSVGKVYCEFKVYGKDGALITSPTFTIIVHDSAVRDEDIVAAIHESTELERLMESYIPCTKVAELPEASEKTKNIVFKKDGRYYVTQSVKVGSGYLAVGKEFASYDKVTDRGYDDLMPPATKYANESGALLYRFVDRSTGDVRSVYWYGGGSYVSEGYFYFEGGANSSQYVMNFYEAPSYETIYPSMYSYGPGCVQILEVTPMGVEFFGGISIGWKNFLTGEEVG